MAPACRLSPAAKNPVRPLLRDNALYRVMQCCGGCDYQQESGRISSACAFRWCDENPRACACKKDARIAEPADGRCQICNRRRRDIRNLSRGNLIRSAER